MPRATSALGARACVPIYNALDPATHHPVAADPRFAADLGFLGNRLPDREARVEEFFLRAAARCPSDRSCSAAAAGTTSRCRRTSATSATSTRRPQRVQLLAARGAEHQPREHGALRLLAGDARLRGRRRRRVPDHRRLGGHRAVPRAGPRGAGRARRRRRSPSTSRDLTPHARARSATRRARARARASTRTRIARAQVEALLGGGRGSGAWRGGAACDRHPRAVHHLVVGQRPRDDLPRPRARARAPRPRRAVPRARRAVVRRQPRPAAAAVRRAPRCTAASTNCASGSPRDVRDADLVIVGSYVPDGIDVGRLGQRDRARRHGLLRHRHAGHARRARSAATCEYLSRGADRRATTCTCRLPAARRCGGSSASTASPCARARCTARSTPSCTSRERGAARVGPRATWEPTARLASRALDRLVLEPGTHCAEGRFVVAGPQYPDRHRVAGERRARGARRARRPSRVLHVAAVHAERDAGRHDRAPDIRRAFGSSRRPRAASPIISDHWTGLETFFVPEEKIPHRRPPGHAALLTDMSEPQRAAIGRRARRRALAEHTATPSGAARRLSLGKRASPSGRRRASSGDLIGRSRDWGPIVLETATARFRSTFLRSSTRSR